MAKPPSDAPVLFDVKCDSSTIKQRKNGSYKLVMEDVERVHWETGDGEAEDGYYNAKKYAKNFDMYYGKDAEVNAYETFTLADGSKEKCKFTITNVKYNQKSNKLVYDITPKNKRQADKITGIESETQTESAVYSTEPTRDDFNNNLISLPEPIINDFYELRLIGLEDILGGGDLDYDDLTLSLKFVDVVRP